MQFYFSLSSSGSTAMEFTHLWRKQKPDFLMLLICLSDLDNRILTHCETFMNTWGTPAAPPAALLLPRPGYYKMFVFDLQNPG